MLKPIPVVLAQYDSEWPHLAKNLAEQLQVLGSCLVTVHHIGSTAVPGLAAKPTIDLMPLVTELAVLDTKRTHIEALGYRWHGEYGISGRRFCTLSDESGRRIAHFHFFTTSSPHVERHIAFRTICARILRWPSLMQLRNAAHETFILTILTLTLMRKPLGFAKWNPKHLLGLPKEKLPTLAHLFEYSSDCSWPHTAA